MRRIDIIAGTDYATTPTQYQSPSRVRVISTEKGSKYVRWEGDQTNTVLVAYVRETMSYATLDGILLTDDKGNKIPTGKVEVLGEPTRIQLSKVDRLWSEYATAKAEYDARVEQARIKAEALRTANLELFESTKDRVKPWFEFGHIATYQVTDTAIGKYSVHQWSQLVTMVDLLIEASMERLNA